MPETIHTFSSDERRVVQQAFAQYLQVVQVIANLHNLEGAISVAPDGSGLVRAAINQ